MRKYIILTTIINLLVIGLANGYTNTGTNTMITTDSGLQYKIIQMGDGDKPEAADKVTVNVAFPAEPDAV